ncbi:MAG: FAD-dependent oxidoreductase [Actinobacteria bacterium]|nr:FAD-dependent oxidoreductase [Actinomycetota bacterium]
MSKVVVIGGGWAGCGAAIAAAKAGAEVVLLERTDMLLGTGLAGGHMRNNGRYTAAEEAIAMGAGELFGVTDAVALNTNVDMPHHKHGSMYNVFTVEPEVRKAVLGAGVDIRLEARFRDVKMDGNRITAVLDDNGNVYGADTFVDCTGTTGSQANCTKYGNGCCMCVLRCPTFGNRVSVAAKAGVKERMVERPGGFGAFSGACEIPKECLAPEIVAELEEKGSLVIPLAPELIDAHKLDIKACKQYSAKEFAENLVILHNGYAKLVTPYFPLEKLRKVPGFEKARFEDPYSGSQGNSIRYLAIAPQSQGMKVEGVENLFCGGEKGGSYVGHTEAICTGSVGGLNAARYAMGLEPVELSRDTVIGDIIAYAREEMVKPGGMTVRFTFAGEGFFKRMKERGMYTTDGEAVSKRVADLGLTGYFNRRVAGGNRQTA